jgi:hypothetical protein
MGTSAHPKNRGIMQKAYLLFILLLAFSGTAFADKPQNTDGVPPGQAKKSGVPPGLAKKGGVPPGLAKKFGPAVPARAYIALDPVRDDRAWFLIDGRWVLKQKFDSGVRIEVRAAMALPPVPPPVPLPALDIAFRVVLFQ